MSYEKVIGFGIDPDDPKAEPRDGRPHPWELSIFKRMGVLPKFISLKENMPEDNREPEQKIFLPNAASFNFIRKLIAASQNGFLIPGQNYEDKNPLTSILLDTIKAILDAQNLSLRYRFETDCINGLVTQADFNEKSGMKGAKIIGGCADRFERELELLPGQSCREGYEAFILAQRLMNDPAFCDTVLFDQLRVGVGYQAARNEIGMAVKHPTDKVLMVFENCEDFWHTTADMKTVMHRFFEFEFEPKQMWGELPSRVRTKQDFKEYVYNTMTMIRDYIHINTPGSTINLKSKAEIAKENLESDHGLDAEMLEMMGLANVFEYAINNGNQQTLDQVMTASTAEIIYLAERLHAQKMRFNETAIRPSQSDIGHGLYTIGNTLQRVRPAELLAYRAA